MSNSGRPTMINCAMNTGIVVGVYYIGKFCFFPLSLHSTMAALLFLGLTLAVPFLIYRLVRQYRERYCGGVMAFSHAFAFSMLIMFFGSLLSAVAHYGYFAFIDNGAMVGALAQSVEQLQGVDFSTIEGATAEAVAQYNQYIEMMEQTTKQIQAMSPIDITVGMLSNNVSWSMVLSLPIALIVSSRKQKKNHNS